MKCDSQASLLARTFSNLCFGHEPKVRVSIRGENTHFGIGKGYVNKNILYFIIKSYLLSKLKYN
jgi:hypothetical protein